MVGQVGGAVLYPDAPPGLARDIAWRGWRASRMVPGDLEHHGHFSE